MEERAALKLGQRCFLLVLRVHKVHDLLHGFQSFHSRGDRWGEALRVTVKDMHALLPLPWEGWWILLRRRRHVVRDARVVPASEVSWRLVRRCRGDRGERRRGDPIRAGSLNARRDRNTGGGFHAHWGGQAAVRAASVRAARIWPRVDGQVYRPWCR